MIAADVDHNNTISTYRKAIALNPEDPVSYMSLAGIYRKMGRQEAYEAAIAAARPYMAKKSPYSRACFEAICDNIDGALTLLKQAITTASGFRQMAQKDQDFDIIRDDPRFKALVGEQE